MANKPVKPTKQQIAQGKARAGGNNPIVVTNAGLKKLGGAAVFAASMTPAGRVARGAVTVAKVARGATKTGKAIERTIAANKADRASVYGEWSMHPGGASAKSHARLTKEGKWSSDKQIARYQRQEAKAEVKGNARGLKAANKPVSKNNAGQNASKLKVDILKNATPLRANRTRLGKSALKSK